jgi:hypothetical protein
MSSNAWVRVFLAGDDINDPQLVSTVRNERHEPRGEQRR